MSTLRVAVVQAGTEPFEGADADEQKKAGEPALAKCERLTAEAGALGAKLAVFPEAFIGGYPKGLDFGARVGSRTAEGRKDFRRYFEGAIDVPGPATDRLGAAARDAGLWLVVGVIERSGGTLYCTALFFSPEGALAAKHRKLMPTAMERLIWGFGDGSTLPVIETSFGKIGAVICWENYMPLLRTAMYSKGIQFYCAPTVDDRETWPLSMRHIAFEGRCFVLSAVQYRPGLIRGGSVIVGPLGQLLAGPVYDTETILTAEVDPGEIAEAKYDFDVTGHYARPDVFKLIVNE